MLMMQEETINIALCLGLNSITAAAVLSGRDHQNPVVVPWPKSSLSFVPLRLQSTSDFGRWGYDCSLTESNTLWGLLRSNHTFLFSQDWNSIHGELLRKRGLPSCTLSKDQHDEGLGTLIRSVTSHIDTWLSSKWGDATSVQKQFLLVIPPYAPVLYQYRLLENWVRKNCALSDIRLATVPHIYGALQMSLLPAFQVGDTIISCYSDLELTAITRYEVMDTKKSLPTLREVSAIFLTTGAHDVAESFSRLLQNDEILGPKCSNSKLARAKEWFFKNLHLEVDQIIQKSIPGLGKLRLSVTAFETNVFSTVFKHISLAVFQAMSQSSAQYISLSGLLAVVPALRSSLPQNVQVFEASQLDTCPYEGACLLPLVQDYLIEPARSYKITLSSNQPAHESFTRNGSAAESTYILFRVQLQILKELEEYYDSFGTQLLLAAEGKIESLEMANQYVELCREYFEKVCKLNKLSLLKSSQHAECVNMDSIHLAAASFDERLVHIGIIGRVSVNQCSSFQYPFGTFKHSPLHTAVWYNKDAKDVVKLLLKSGATVEGFGHECPMHFATARDLPTVLRIFEQECKEKFTLLVPDLLQLAIDVGARSAVKFFISRVATCRQTYYPCPSRLSKTPLAHRSAYKPLVEMLTRRWAEEATLMLKQYIRNHELKDPVHTSFDDSGDEFTQMNRFLDQWILNGLDVTDEDDENALHWTVRLGHADLLWKHNDLIVSGVSFETRLRHAFTTATKFKKYQCIVPLLENGPSFTEAEKHVMQEGFCQNLDLGTIERLFRKATSLQYEHKVSPWSKNGHNVMVELLRQAGKIEATSEVPHRTRALLRATGKGDAAMVKKLLDTSRTDANVRDEKGWTPLLLAAIYGHDAVVQLLLGLGKAEVDCAGGNGWTPLLAAARNGHTKVVQLLIETGKADINGRIVGSTPLEMAAERGHATVVQLLLVTMEARDSSQFEDIMSAMHRAMLKSHDAVIRLFLATHYFDPNIKDSQGDSVLSWAAAHGYATIVKHLLETGQVEIDAKNKFGATPLCYAATWGHAATVKLLIETGHVNINSTDNWGKTPLQMAIEYGNDAVVNLLRESLAVETSIDDQASDQAPVADQRPIERSHPRLSRMLSSLAPWTRRVKDRESG